MRSTSESTSAKIKTYCVLETQSNLEALKGKEQESTNFSVKDQTVSTFCFVGHANLTIVMQKQSQTIRKLMGMTRFD